MISTKIKRTAIAPTQITIKETGKNSKLNKNRKPATLTKAKIKNRTEKTGFLVKTTKNEEKIEKEAKKQIN